MLSRSTWPAYRLSNFVIMACPPDVGGHGSGRPRLGNRSGAMPELPDVELYKRVLDEHGLGRVVMRVAVPDPGSLEGATAATLQRRLKNRRLSGSSRHGKVLFAAFEDAMTLAMHFGTNGSLQA